jgi:hypothetical protein
MPFDSGGEKRGMPYSLDAVHRIMGAQIRVIPRFSEFKLGWIGLKRFPGKNKPKP